MRLRVLSLMAATAVAAAAATAAWALPITVVIDPSQSSVTAELCVSGKCDADTSPVTGMAIVELDCVDAPEAVWLYDFHVAAQNTMNFSLSWGLLGSLTATGSGLSLYYAQPGIVLGPESVAGGSFDFAAVPALKTGNLVYHASGVPCLALQSAGLLCDDSYDLASDGQSLADWKGTVTTANRVVMLSSTIDTTTPLDPNNPSLGSLRVSGTIRGTVYVARPTGDVDGDGDVDVLDWAYFAPALSGPDVTAPPPGTSAYHFAGSDLEQDGDVDLADAALLQRAQPVGF